MTIYWVVQHFLSLDTPLKKFVDKKQVSQVESLILLVPNKPRLSSYKGKIPFRDWQAEFTDYLLR